MADPVATTPESVNEVDGVDSAPGKVALIARIAWKSEGAQPPKPHGCDGSVGIYPAPACMVARGVFLEIKLGTVVRIRT